MGTVSHSRSSSDREASIWLKDATTPIQREGEPSTGSSGAGHEPIRTELDTTQRLWR